MRIVVLGGGVVGVTTAYQLQKDGHEVVVLERNSELAAEASWGNAGMIAPGHSFVWSSPKAPMILLKSLVSRGSGVALQVLRRPRLYSWSWAFLMECTAGKGAPQHAAQTSPRRLFAGRPRAGRGATKPSSTIAASAASSISTATRKRSSGRRAHEAARIRRPGDQGARPRGGHRARTRRLRRRR